MGVPAFFRWLTRKYPSVVVPCVEEKGKDFDGNVKTVDASQPNPNGVEFDNLYLDMNGIIHPCTHPEDRPAPKNEDEMMVAIFECIDRLFRIVRPRKVLYMAIDGVAPRAKMNQQRSRRFRSSKETSEKIDEIARIRKELADKGAYLPPEKPKGEHFDSNCITPGTPFMARLSACLHYYVHARLNSDPGWKDIKVILSDANVPGEGEHKIMDYIRKQRAQPDHDPNTHHVLCGADADLIMLGLATHEVNFTIIREEFKPNQPRPCDICGQLGHEMKECQGTEANAASSAKTYGSEQEFIFVRLSVLREYLERELAMPNLPFKYDFERAIDDWVFMCFFVGNDFLPHLPSLEIRENAIDRLVTLYKKTVYKTNGWLTNSGEVYLDRVQLIMADLGDVEDEIFKRRQQDEIAFKARMKAKNERMKRFRDHRPKWVPGGQFAPTPLGRGAVVDPIQNVRQEAFQMRRQGMSTDSGPSNVDRNLINADANAGLQALLKPAGESSDSARGEKRKREDDNEEDENPNDEVRLWEDGFKDRYYESKFDVSKENIEFRFKVGHHYVRGLCWVLQYYYQGCASWDWYFPYHYAPFASDFVNVAEVSQKFDTKNTKPFKPLEQLMGVFPAASRSHVPEPWGQLMTDPDSPIIDFYPEDFKIDLNGKKYAWQGVALLPFVEEKRLHKALKEYYPLLTPAEIKRNIRGDDRLYIPQQHEKYSFFRGLYENGVDPDIETDVQIDGMQGRVLLAEDNCKEGASLDSPVMGLPVLRQNAVICVRYRDPQYPDGFIYPAKRLPGAIEPPRVLKPGEQNRDVGNWKQHIGMGPRTYQGSLNEAGHRMLGHHVPRGGRGGGGSGGHYSNVPPPMSGGGRGGYGGHRGHSSGGYSGGRNYQQGNGSQGHRGGQGYRGGQSHQSGWQSQHSGSQSAYPSYQSSSRGGYQPPSSGYGSGGGYQSSGYQSSNQGGYSSSNRGGYQSSNRGGYQSSNSGGYPSSNRGSGSHRGGNVRGGNNYRGNSQNYNSRQ
ncbi:5'-3' exoribonuclease 2 homolog [Thrips palmi]|uniref:5'-3' exoribonuclease n=1 Tax=Thrips palmi TaxID=161013 RepID=A0A6P8YBK8_THRPL|nr:5'-3' exoribonuclease 2 homolog [Thrips palmi]